MSVSRLISFLKHEPKRMTYTINSKAAVGEWKQIYEVGTKCIKAAAGGGRRPVLLLDEVDRSLDFVRQNQVWRQMKQLATDHQIIIASHSPFAVDVEGAHYIETDPNYLEKARVGLRTLLVK
jgi:DNA repair ATPase RecN